MKLYLFIITLFFSFNIHSETLELPKFGKKKSDTYFHARQKRQAQRQLANSGVVTVGEDPYQAPVAQQPPRQQILDSQGTHVMALQVGFFLDDKAHRWGPESTEEDVGQWSLGVTYQMGEWVNSMDLYFRADLQGYKVEDESANKLSLLGMVTFPDIRSGFPIYFGAGLGLGIFFDQIEDESSLSLDYQIVLGARVLDIYEGIGFIAEAGVKNHVFLTSKGQFNGYFLSLGAVFKF